MSTTQSVLLAGACLLIGLAIGWGLTGTDAKATKISWEVGDTKLFIDLEKDLASEQTLLEKIFSEEFSSLGATGWLKTNRELYRYDDPSLIAKIAELDYNSVSSREFRQLRQDGKGPWFHQAQDIVISFPGNEYTAKGKANGCSPGPFHRKKVAVFLKDDQDQRVIVDVVGPYPCEGETARADGRLRRSDIQISYADAKVLFGDKKLGKYEKAMAKVVD